MHREVTRAVDAVRWDAAAGWWGGAPPGIEDLEQTDPGEARKLKGLLGMPPEELSEWLRTGELEFRTTSREASVAPLMGVPLGAVGRLESDLLGGHSPADRVTRDTVGEYAELVCHKKLVEDVTQQMAQIQRGMLEVVPASKLQGLSASDLELALGGEPRVDAGDWKRHSVSKGFSPGAPQVSWFWETVEEAPEGERLALFEWTTGMACPPPGGLAQLGDKFVLQCDPDPAHADRLPCSHACGFQLDLPVYPSKGVLQDKLRLAVQEGASFELA